MGTGDKVSMIATETGRGTSTVQSKPLDAVEPAATKAAAPQAKYSSVIYVHGIGSQRRYEETSRLIDKIDKYLVQEYRRGNAIGKLQNIEVLIEPMRSEKEGDDTIAFIRTRFSVRTQDDDLDEDNAPGKGQRHVSAVRFYEAYWASILAGAKSPIGVLKWVLAQAARPWKTLPSPWRERQRLRRAALVALYTRDGVKSPEAAHHDFTKLITAYHEFEGLSAHRKFPAGRFEDFVAFLAERTKAPETLARRTALARRWRRAYIVEELRNAFSLLTLALTLLLLFGAAAAGVMGLLKSVLAWPQLSAAVTALDLPFKADVKTVVTILGAVATFLGLGKFLTDYLGDVEVWSTYEETDEKHVARDKVLANTVATFSHVLRDPNCERVTIVAHSLGTSIAHDALLAIRRSNRATNEPNPMSGPIPLWKIEHFVTMGSPIDKIEYFFESYSSASHRYKRVIENLRGDIGEPPFSRKGEPHAHWVNFWDLGDPISGSLDSPASAAEFCQHVDNVQVASFDFPRPGASHSGYFDHRAVIGHLFQIIYNRAYSFQSLPPGGERQRPDYGSVHLGLGEPAGGGRIAYLLLAAATPWLSLVGIVTWIAGLTAASVMAWALAGGCAGVLTIGFAVSLARGHRKPL